MNGEDPVKINENTIPRNILIKDVDSIGKYTKRRLKLKKVYII